MTKEEAQQFLERWRIVNERINEEIRNTPPSIKLRQLEIMRRAAVHFAGAGKGRDEGISEVRERWRRLRARYV